MKIPLNRKIESLSHSVTLELNSLLQQLREEGKRVFNLTAGQLPYRPPEEFVGQIQEETKFLQNFQYSPVAGMKDLREKLWRYWVGQRQLMAQNPFVSQMKCFVSNGGKQALFNIFSTILNPEDEVIVVSPFWLSYPDLIYLAGGRAVFWEAKLYEGLVPDCQELEALITPKTKAIVINSPNNPAGIHYSEEWMKEFASIVKKYPSLFLISDEIYYEVCYFDPAPTYFYSFDPSLLERTFIVDGISKKLASTGLRLGYAFAPEAYFSPIESFQGHITSGPNTLVQHALLNFDLLNIQDYLRPIKYQLRNNAEKLLEMLRPLVDPSLLYRPSSAFYYILDLSPFPCFPKIKEEDKKDYSPEICRKLLEKTGVGLVPGGPFGRPNSVRLSLVMDEIPFQEALNRLRNFLTLT